MARKVYEETNIQAIADKIREKTGGNSTYKTSEMPSGIDAVYSKGYSQGDRERYEIMMPDMNNAYEGGYIVGFDDGYSLGKSSEYNAFWDNFQQKGKRTYYYAAFSYWDVKAFKPKYNIVPTGNIYQMFREFNNGGDICDLADHIEKNGIVLDFSNVTDSNYLFYLCHKISRIGIVDISGCTDVANTFFKCENLITVDKLVLNSGGHRAIYTPFEGCDSLKNITIEGTIDKDWDMKSCPLSKESFYSVFNALSDTTTGKTVTFSLSAVNSAFAISEEWTSLVASKSNWTVTLV